jgi:hypothetical protein
LGWYRYYILKQNALVYFEVLGLTAQEELYIVQPWHGVIGEQDPQDGLFWISMRPGLIDSEDIFVVITDKR